VAHVNASWNLAKRAWVHEFADSTPKRHAAAIPGIKLSHPTFMVPYKLDISVDKHDFQSELSDNFM
jgi:hypothetical protein